MPIPMVSSVPGSCCLQSVVALGQLVLVPLPVRLPQQPCCCATQVVHPLSVSHNKLGDLEYGLGNVQAAVAEYQQGLTIREEALQQSQHSSPSQHLDVAVSIIKVADACQVTGAYCHLSRQFPLSGLHLRY